MINWSTCRAFAALSALIALSGPAALAAPPDPFDEAGIILYVDMLGCVVFESDLGGLYHLDDFQRFGIGDEVCVSGLVFDDGCETGCKGPVFVRCVEVESIRDCDSAGVYIDECGTLVNQTGDLPGIVCKRFLTDDGQLYLVGETGSFTVGDRAHVTGMAQGPCSTLVCGPFTGCMIYNGIRACAGDLDEDGHVNGLDLALLLGYWGRCRVFIVPGVCEGDLNEDGIVNGLDLAMLLAAWS